MTVLNVIAAAIRGVEQRIVPVGVKQARQGMGQMMVEETHRGVATQPQFSQHAVGTEHVQCVAAPGADQFALHRLVLALADQLPDLALDQASAAKMAVIAPRKRGAAQHDRIDILALDPGNPQALVDGLEWHPAAIGLAPREAFEGNCGAHAVIVEHARPGVVIAGMDAKNNHRCVTPNSMNEKRASIGTAPPGQLCRTVRPEP